MELVVSVTWLLYIVTICMADLYIDSTCSFSSCIECIATIDYIIPREVTVGTGLRVKHYDGIYSCTWNYVISSCVNHSMANATSCSGDEKDASAYSLDTNNQLTPPYCYQKQDVDDYNFVYANFVNNANESCTKHKESYLSKINDQEKHQKEEENQKEKMIRIVVVIFITLGAVCCCIFACFMVHKIIQNQFKETVEYVEQPQYAAPTIEFRASISISRESKDETNTSSKKGDGEEKEEYLI
eukprot:47527_1